MKYHLSTRHAKQMNCNLKHQPQTIFCVSFKITLLAIPYLKQINQSCGYVVRLSSRSPRSGVSLSGEFSPNFQHEKHDLDQYKLFFTEKKKTQIHQKKIARFFMISSSSSQEFRRILNFNFFTLVCSQI